MCAEKNKVTTFKNTEVQALRTRAIHQSMSQRNTCRKSRQRPQLSFFTTKDSVIYYTRPKTIVPSLYQIPYASFILLMQTNFDNITFFVTLDDLKVLTNIAYK